MKICALINPQSGSMRRYPVHEFEEMLQGAFSDKSAELTTRQVKPGALESTLEEVGQDADILLTCGGDGTVTSVASYCVEHGRVLGIMPCGTMNLFARSLGIPLDLQQAGNAIASGKVKQVDYGTANDRLFLHQFSVGMQPALVRKRARFNYESRIGKILAGLAAAAGMVLEPPVFSCRITANGSVLNKRLSMIAVSNNLHAEGHLPYPDRVDENILGLYYAGKMDTAEAAKLISDLMLGKWSTNPDLQIASAKKVILEFGSHAGKGKALIDGEISDLENRVEIVSHAGGLKVLAPGPAKQETDI